MLPFIRVALVVCMCACGHVCVSSHVPVCVEIGKQLVIVISQDLPTLPEFQPAMEVDLTSVHLRL